MLNLKIILMSFCLLNTQVYALVEDSSLKMNKKVYKHTYSRVIPKNSHINNFFEIKKNNNKVYGVRQRTAKLVDEIANRFALLKKEFFSANQESEK